MLDPEDRTQYVNSAIPESGELPYELTCMICLCLADDPLLCVDCETAVTCKGCFDDWKIQMGRKIICPACKGTKQPVKFIKLMQQVRSQLRVKCTKDNCSHDG